jgi:clan AA aspartic protease
MARMKGYIDKYYQPKIKLKAKGFRRTIELDAVIDTGFDGELCLPLPIDIQLGLELRGNQYVELADGTVKYELIFAGIVILEDKEIPVDISLTNSAEGLLGIGLLMNKKLTINFPEKVVEIEDVQS